MSLVDDGWGYFDKKIKDDDGNEYKQIEGMFKWKDRNPKVKIVWSLGGWSYSKPFY